MNYDLSTEEGFKNALDWTSRTVTMLAEGGQWGIPRSGVIVRRDGPCGFTVLGGDRDEHHVIFLLLTAAGFDVVSDLGMAVSQSTTTGENHE